VHTEANMALPGPLTDPTKNEKTVIISNTEHLLDHIHTLWMATYFNSSDLQHFLTTKDSDCVGKLCEHEKSHFSCENKKLKKGKIVSQLMWQSLLGSKKTATFITTTMIRLV
jgi:hypothetical protein